LTILGIVIGTGLVVGMMAAGEGVERNIYGNLDKFGPETIILSPTSITAQLTARDADRVTQISQVKRVIPQFAEKVRVTSEADSKDHVLIGLDQSAFTDSSFLKGLTFEHGTYVSHDDAEGIVLGASVAHPPGTDIPFARINQSISVEVVRFVNGEQDILRQTFIVRGILAEYGQTLMPVDTAVFVSLDAARTLLGTSSYTIMFVTTQAPTDVERVAAQLDEMFGEDIEIKTMAYFTESVQELPITLFMGSIAAVALIVAGTSIANIMFVSVMERTREIGVLKALGSTRGNILWLFFSEAILTGLIGGILGCGLGILFGYAVAGFLVSGETSLVSPIFTVGLMGFAIGFAILIAGLAGFYPSWKASQKPPIEALRWE